MNQGLLDNRLENYFKQEAEVAEISTDQWSLIVGEATKRGQQSPKGFMQNISNRFGTSQLTAVAAVIAVLIVGAVSILISESWDSSEPRGPGGAPGVPGGAGVTGNAGAPGSPGHRYFDIDWNTEVRGYVPGDSITIIVTLQNIHHEALVLAEVELAPSQPFTGEMSPFNGKADGGPNAIRLDIPGDIPELLLVGEKLDIPITISPDITSNFATGKYSMEIHLRYTVASDTARENIKGLGSFSGTAFVILPPEGALVKTVHSGESIEVGGVNVTLVAIDFGAEETVISAVINVLGLDNQIIQIPNTPAPALAKSLAKPDPSSQRLAATAAPAATPAPRAPGSEIIEIHAKHRIDDAIWEFFPNYEHAGQDGAVFVEWTIGPIPKTAKTFDLLIQEVKIYPDESVYGSWEWSIPLTDN